MPVMRYEKSNTCGTGKGIESDFIRLDAFRMN